MLLALENCRLCRWLFRANKLWKRTQTLRWRARSQASLCAAAPCRQGERMLSSGAGRTFRHSQGFPALLTSAVWGCQASLKAVLANERVSNRSRQPDSPTCSGKVVFVGEQLTEGMLFAFPLPLKMDFLLTLLFSGMPAAIAHLWQAIRKPLGLPSRCCSHLAEEKHLQGGSAAAPHKSQQRLRDKSQARS